MRIKDIKLFLLAITLGISPYLFFSNLILISLIPLIYILYAEGSIRWRYYLAVVFTGSLIALSPLVRYDIGVYLFALAFSTFFITSFCIISKFLIMRYNQRAASTLIPPLVWMVLYYLFGLSSLAAAFDVGSQITYTSTSPVIWYTGTVGITFLIIFMASSIAYSLAGKDKIALMAGLVIILIFAFCFAYTHLKDPKDFAMDKKPIKIAMIQGNIHEKWEWLQKNPYTLVERYRTLSLEAAKSEPHLIVWPEFAIPLDFINYNKEVRKAIKEIILSSGTNFIIGSIIYDEKTKFHEDAALIFDEKANLIGHYSSINPAPFNRFTKKSKKPLKTFLEGAGIMVCWEELSSPTSRRYTVLGSEYLVSIANNQDLDKTYLMRFASHYSQARASENKRYLLRAANTGITQIIDPLGKVTKKIPPETYGILIGEVWPISEKTFYSRYGDVLVKICLLLTSIYLIFSYFNHRNLRGCHSATA